MLTDRIIGRVGANLITKRISSPGQQSDSVALFRLDKLSSSQIAAVARAILANPDLLARIDLMIPEVLVEGQSLPAEILISHNAGYVRNNALTAKASILTANGNEHNLADTLGHVMAIGAKEMRADPEPWVEAALHAGGLSPVPDDRAVFHAALGGLLVSSELSLVQLGEFCSDKEGDLLALHPTVKPVRLVSDAILDCSARGDLILDPFLGSGTTILAAERTGRIAYGLELEPGYVDTAIRRWQALTGQKAKHARSNRLFDQGVAEQKIVRTVW